MKIGKKGFLLGESTLKMIIAVISLALLFYLLFTIYSSSQDNKQLKMAESTLNDLVEVMNRARDTNEEQTIVLLEPSKWLLLGFSNDMNKPEECFGRCICVCTPNEKGFHVVSSEEDLCNSLGVCKNMDYEFDKFAYSLRTGSIDAKITKILTVGFGGVETAEELGISYKEDKIEITKK